MPAVEPGKIRNVAVVGHRGTGKTSLVEAMLFQAGATNRLGVVEQGTTDLRLGRGRAGSARCRSPARSAHLEWQGRKINLIDTPGEPSFQGDAIAALHVVEGALVAVSGVMGVEVQTAPQLAARGRARPRPRRLREHARPRARRLLPNARAAPRAARRRSASPIHLPIGAEHELTGHRRPPAHDGVHEPGGRARRGAPARSRRSWPTRSSSTARSCSTRSSRPTRR